jgi:deoxyhypusine synthase
MKHAHGKVDEDAQTVTVYGDATITLPLIISAVLADGKDGGGQ